MRPWLTAEEVRRLRRADAQAWTESDLPILDAARLRLGDPEASRRRRRHEAAAAAEREQMDRVVESLLADETLADADADGEGALVMLRGEDLRESWPPPTGRAGWSRMCWPDRSRTSSWTRPRN